MVARHADRPRLAEGEGRDRARSGDGPALALAGSTDPLRAGQSLELPADWESFEQLIAVAAMRGYERGLLPRRSGDFPAHETGYRELSAAQRTEVLSIAWERQRALEWLCGAGKSSVEAPTST